MVRADHRRVVFNIFQLGFLFQIEGQVLLTDITGEIALFEVCDNEGGARRD